MQQIKSRLAGGLMLLVTLFVLSGCVADEDWWSKDNLVGRWRVVEANVYDGTCPYYYNDQLIFSSNGYYDAYGSNGFEEHGTWDISRNRLYFNFGPGNDVVADIMSMDNTYMVLRVNDPSAGYYDLRLVRSGY